MAPTTDHSPPDGHPMIDPDSDRRSVGSIAELNERLADLDEQIIRLKIAQDAESTARRAGEYDLAERDGRLAGGLMSTADALNALREETRKAIEGIKGEIDGMKVALLKEIAGLRRQDSIHDGAIEQVNQKLTVMQMVSNAAGRAASAAVKAGLPVLLYKIAEALFHHATSKGTGL